MSTNERDADAPDDAENVARRVETACWEAFEEVDQNNTGQVNSDEVSQIINRMNFKMTQDEIYKLIAEIDPDN